MPARKTGRGGVLDRIRVSAAVKRNQSSLYQWYVRNYTEFAAIVEGVSRPGWDAIAAELRAEGITKQGGGDLTPSYARQTWWKVRQAHGKGAGPKPASKTAPKLLARRSTKPTTVIVEPDPVEDGDKPPVFAPVRYRTTPTKEG